MLPRSIKNTKQIVEKIKIMSTVSNKKAKCINLSFFLKILKIGLTMKAGLEDGEKGEGA